MRVNSTQQVLDDHQRVDSLSKPGEPWCNHCGVVDSWPCETRELAERIERAKAMLSYFGTQGDSILAVLDGRDAPDL